MHHQALKSIAIPAENPLACLMSGSTPMPELRTNATCVIVLCTFVIFYQHKALPMEKKCERCYFECDTDATARKNTHTEHIHNTNTHTISYTYTHRTHNTHTHSFPRTHTHTHTRAPTRVDTHTTFIMQRSHYPK